MIIMYIFTNESGNSYTQCDVNSSGIESSTCITVTPSGRGALNTPNGIGFDDNYVYFH